MSRTMPRWLTYTLLTMLLWGAWGFASKPISAQLSAWEVQTLSAVGLLPVLLVLAGTAGLRANPGAAASEVHTRAWFRNRGFWLAWGSGMAGGAGNIAYYKVLGAGAKAAAVTPLTALYPLVTILLAILVLRERINLVQALGGLGSLGALYFFNVGSESGWLTPWLALALIPIALWGVSALLQKLATNAVSGELATAAFLAGMLCLSALVPFLFEVRWSLSPSTWALGLVVGVLLGLGNLTLILAYGTGGKPRSSPPWRAFTRW